MRSLRCSTARPHALTAARLLCRRRACRSGPSSSRASSSSPSSRSPTCARSRLDPALVSAACHRDAAPP
eukprot:3093918-Prymnesium_polylepis.1